MKWTTLVWMLVVWFTGVGFEIYTEPTGMWLFGSFSIIAITATGLCMYRSFFED